MVYGGEPAGCNPSWNVVYFFSHYLSCLTCPEATGGECRKRGYLVRQGKPEDTTGHLVASFCLQGNFRLHPALFEDEEHRGL